MSKSFKSRALLGAAAAAIAPAALLASASISPAFAQDEDADDVIVVTGSRILKTNENSAIPLKTVDSVAIDLTGEVNAGDIIRNLPAAGVSALSPSNSNFVVQGAGVQTVDLRNLGEDRTLVLVNGRRFVSGLPGSQIVDFNSIPVDFIERIDVITGGASAVYGSDALAGAVNIILKDDFEGIAISGQYGETWKYGDDKNEIVRLTAGSSFADGRGHAIVNASWSQEEGVFARNRPLTAIDCTNLGFFTGDENDAKDCFTPTFSSFPPNTRIVIPTGNNTTGNRVIDPVTGVVRPYAGATDGFNRNAIRALSTPIERMLLSTVTEYELAPYANVFIEGTYARTQATSELEPFPLSSEDVFDGLPFCFDTGMDGLADTCDPSTGVPISSGVVPQSVRDAVLAANPQLNAIPGDPGEAVIGFARRLSEVGNRGASAKRQTFRIVTGVEGDLMQFVEGDFFKNLDYELSLNYGTTTENQISNGQLNVSNLREAFNVEPDGLGGVRCVNPVARAEGCVPVFIFGQNTIDQDALAYISADSLRDIEIEQVVVSGFVTSRFGKLPWGDSIGLSVGGEYRRERSRDTPDALSQTGQNAGNVQPVQIGSFNVVEGFAEVELPIIVDRPFIKNLTIGGAVRVSDYSTVGSTFAWAGNGDWAVNDWMRFRGQYAKAVRAPNIGELFSAGGETFATVNDPCAGVTINPMTMNPAFFNTTLDINNPANVLASGINAATDNSILAQNCMADPIIAARVAQTGGLALTQPEFQGTGGFVGGSPPFGTLTEETSKSWQIGIVLTPTTGVEAIDGFGLSVDYFNISIDDALATVGRQTSLDFCYSPTELSFGGGNPFCANVVRFGQGPQIGALDEVNGGLLNIANLQTEGIDFQLNYSLPVSGIPILTELGDSEIFFGATYTYLLENEDTQFGQTTDNVGLVGYSKHKALANFVYTTGPLTFNWETTIVGPAGIDWNVIGDRLVHYGTEAFHDLQIRYNLNETASLVFGIDNIFNNFVPVGGTNGDLGQPVGARTFPDVYEPFGRAWYAGARFHF